MRFIPISEARTQLSTLLGQGVCALTQHGQPAGVLMDYATYESLQALLAAARDPEGFATMIREHERFQSGEDDPEDVSADELLGFLERSAQQTLLNQR